MSNVAEKPCQGAAHEGGDKWTIDIPDLTALLDLIREVGDRVIIDNGLGSDPPHLPSIEIYDDWPL